MEKEELIYNFASLLKAQRYRFSTIKVYRSAIDSFLTFFNGNDLRLLPPEFIQTYIDSRTPPGRLSTAYYCQAAAAIRLFYKKILNTELKLNYPEKRINKLPFILNTEQVKFLLGNIKNIKHQALLSLIYSAGLRLSEIINLKKSSVFMAERRIDIIPDSSAKKRSVMISGKMFLLLEEYFKYHKPVCWLFETNKNQQYSPRTIQQIFKNALISSSIKCEATVQTLRHSFAVHLLEEGIDIRVIQQILGHKSIKSTLVYSHLSSTKLSKIANPFDIY
jgi:site-specific recombinase XerD